MRRLRVLLGTAGLLLALFAFAVPAAWASVSISLRGSPDSMQRQHKIARSEGLSFVETAEEVQALVAQEKLVALRGNEHYTVLKGVSFPYARPELRLFIGRLAEQYHEATGEKLVVTSLTRPAKGQPWNAHRLSVHPAGMAVDFRVSRSAASRQWLESVLLKLERQGLLDATRERRPPHYHVALFPNAYRAHVEGLIGPRALSMALLWGHGPEVEKAVPIRLGSDALQPPKPPTLIANYVSKTSEGKHQAASIFLLLVLASGIGYWYVRKR